MTLKHKEQAFIDKHDDDISTHTVCLQYPTRTVRVAMPTASYHCKTCRKLSRLEAGLSRVDETVTPPPNASIEHSLLKQCQEQFSDYKKELTVLCDELLAEDIPDEDELFVLHSRLEE